MAAVTTAKKILTLCFFERGDEVLLGMKKRGFGVGLWNGFGGKVEAGEAVEAAAHVELHARSHPLRPGFTICRAA